MGNVETSEDLVRIVCLLMIRMFLVVRKYLSEKVMWCSPLLCLTFVGNDISAPTEVKDDFVLEHVKKSVPEKDAAHDATTSAARENLDNIVIPESPDDVIVPDKEKGSEATTTDNVFVHDIYVIPYVDDSGKTMSVPLNVDESAEKDSNVIYVDNLNLTERTPASSTRRLRSNAGKGVAVSNVPVKTAKEKKIYGLKRQWSKITRPSEPKKKLLRRKTISSSDSEFEEDQHATASPAASSKKSVKKKRIPQDVSPVPIDNISFHRFENVDRWKFVIKRWLAVERNLSEVFFTMTKAC